MINNDKDGIRLIYADKQIFKNKRPFKIAVFDVECWKDATKFAFGVVLYGEYLDFKLVSINHKVFYDKEEMAYFLKESNDLKGYKIYAHNGSGYDYITLFGNYVLNTGTDLLMAGNKIVSWKVNKRTFYDSLMLFRTSVDSLGKALGMEKGTTPEKFINGDYTQGINDDDVAYCLRDCEIVYKSIEKLFLYQHKLSSTIGGLSMAAFKKSLKSGIRVKKQYDDLFKHTYRGGRTECYYVGKYDKAYYYDVNSMYPYVMAYYTYPDPENLRQYDKTFTDKNKILNFIKRYEGMAFFDIIVKNNKIGCLPYKHNDRLCFPVGNIKGYYNFNEIRTAYEYGLIDIIEMKDCIYSNPVYPPFKDFVLSHYEERIKCKNNNNKHDELLLKYILNNLYGKFGQKKKKRVLYYDDVEKMREDMYREGINVYYTINDYHYIKLEGSEYKNAVYCWASYITSWARCVLLSYMVEIGFENILYCDTDSLIVTKQFKDSRISDYKLGYLKLEGIGSFIGVKSKMYRFNDKVKIKGAIGITELDYKNGCFYFDGQPVTYDYIVENALIVFKDRVYTLIKPKSAIRNRAVNDKLGIFTANEKFFDIVDIKRIFNGMNNFNIPIKI